MRKLSAASALSQYIGAHTRDGEELVNLLLDIARGSAPDKIRLEALEMLFDRFAGKPLAVIEAHVTPGGAPERLHKMSEMSREQLEALSVIGLLPNGKPPIDV